MGEARDKIIASITDDPANAAETMVEMQIELIGNQNTLNQLRRNLSAAADSIGALLPYAKEDFDNDQYEEIVEEIGNYNSLADYEKETPPSSNTSD